MVSIRGRISREPSLIISTESSGTALFTCPLSNGVGADYTITFCP